MNKLANYSSVLISDLQALVYLGCKPEEHKKKQLISISVELKFNKAPLGNTSDQLQDTVCYAQIVQSIKNYLKQKHFHLLEHLTFSLHKMLRSTLAKNSNIAVLSITIRKNPKIQNLQGGIFYTYSD